MSLNSHIHGKRLNWQKSTKEFKVSAVTKGNSNQVQSQENYKWHMISQTANNNDNSVLIPNNQFPFLLWRNQFNCILNCILLNGILTNNWHEPCPVVNLFYNKYNIVALNSIVLLNAEYYYIFKAAHAQTEETLSQRNYVYILRWMDQWTVLPARHTEDPLTRDSVVSISQSNIKRLS